MKKYSLIIAVFFVMFSLNVQAQFVRLEKYLDIPVEFEAAFVGLVCVGDHDGQQMVWRGGIDDGLEGWLRGIKRWWLDAWKGNPQMRTEW